jgi:hypothetical protein
MDDFYKLIFRFSISILLISVVCMIIVDKNSAEFIVSTISTILSLIVFILTYILIVKSKT